MPHDQAAEPLLRRPAIVALYLLALFAAQAADTLPPHVKLCPDGSRILATDTCAPQPDHRFEFPHQPEAKVKTVEWWCRGDRRPSLARIRIVQHSRRDASGRSIIPLKTVELMNLKVKGAAPSATSRIKIAQTLGSLNEAELGGRCLFQRSGGIQSVLTIRGYQDGRRDPVNLDIKLDARGTD